MTFMLCRYPGEITYDTRSTFPTHLLMEDSWYLLTANRRKTIVTAATNEMEAPANVASVRSLHDVAI